MKKFIFIIVLALILVSANSVYALGDSQALRTPAGIRSTSDSGDSKVVPTSAVSVTGSLSKLDDLKARADLEISRRTDALNKLIIRINDFKRLSSVQKSGLTTQVQAQIDSLNALKTKIDADTDITTLKADVKSIVTNYRIYVFFIQDINLIAAAERMGTAIDNMTVLSGKLQTRITDAGTKGSDVSALNAKYADMLSELGKAKVTVDEVNSMLSGLTASGYPGNKTTLDDARAKLRTAFTNLKNSYQDGFQIIRLLKEIKLFPTLTPTLTPTPAV